MNGRGLPLTNVTPPGPSRPSGLAPLLEAAVSIVV